MTTATMTINAALLVGAWLQKNPSKGYLLLLGAVVLVFSAVTAASVMSLQALLPRISSASDAVLSQGQLELKICLSVLTTIGCGLGMRLIFQSLAKHPTSAQPKLVKSN